MTVNIGVIGTGLIGQDHIRRLNMMLAGSAVVAVSDADNERAREVADRVGARVLPTGLDLINDPDVDAVVVASWGPTHEEFVLAAIESGKSVFCEKPLATTQSACQRIVSAEQEHGKRLVQVGFMRRYDAAYLALKEATDSGEIGAPLLMHCAHRIPQVADNFTSEMAINDAAIHEFDMVRWIFGSEVVGVRVFAPRHNRNSRPELLDPLFIILEMDSGALVDIEVSANIRYGYDIRGEIVGELGTASLENSSALEIRSAFQARTQVPGDWQARFSQAYDSELRDWISGIETGVSPKGPSSWDGYAATCIADAALEALQSGNSVAVNLESRPTFYDS